MSHAVGMARPAYEIAIDPGEGLSGKAFLTGKPSIYADREATELGMSTAQKENLRRFEEATGGVRFPESALSAGLVYKGEPIGAFVVENLYVPHAFNSFDLDIVDALAQAAAIAIVNARLFESERDTRIKLEALNEEIRIQRDQLQRRVGVQESLSDVVKEGLPLSVLATRLAGLTDGAVVILDALNRVRSGEPQPEAEAARELDWLPPESLHDSQIMARLLPSALVFVPSAGGVSHHPDEWTSPEAIAKGVDVLVGSLIRLDDVLSSTLGHEQDHGSPATDISTQR